MNESSNCGRERSLDGIPGKLPGNSLPEANEWISWRMTQFLFLYFSFVVLIGGDQIDVVKGCLTVKICKCARWLGAAG